MAMDLAFKTRVIVTLVATKKKTQTVVNCWYIV